MKTDIEILSEVTGQEKSDISYFSGVNRIRPDHALEAMRIAVEQANGWVSVETGLPMSNGLVKCYDVDSLTPEKELLYEDGKFYYEAHGVRLDYTATVSLWKPLIAPPIK